MSFVYLKYERYTTTFWIASAGKRVAILLGIAKLFAASAAGTGCAMQIPSSMPRLKGFRF
ncbi:hypothetical protein ABIE58_003989, partial [Roseovarius sp. MBR-78]